MLTHGFSPDGFNVSTIQPIVKNKRKSMNDSGNYRAIALGSPLSKIFDWIILNKNVCEFVTSDMQYGFKAKSSTTQCTFAMMETVNYYRQHNTDVYVLLLDASQAFDKVNYVKLFQLLIKRNVNPLIIRCLVYMYTNQYMNIKWNCSMSKYFSTSNGVKQGGVLSPILFGIYIDELLSLLRNSGYGCKVGHLYCGTIGYADDVSFISPSLHALKMMCDISLAFASEFDIKFNPIKCQLLYYGKCKNVSLDFDGVVICASDKATHLGHIIGPNVSESVMLNASATLTRSINFVLHNFSHCSYDVKYALFKSYCTSYYGSSLWNITDKLMSVFYVTWRKAIRKVFRLPYRTHCDLLPVIAECSHIETQLLCRLVKFVNGAISSHNVQLNLLMNIAINGSLSHMSDNINHMLSKAKITRHMVKSYNINNLLDIVNKNVNIPSENSVKIGAFVRTVVFDRDYASFLSIEELNSILNIICTE